MTLGHLQLVALNIDGVLLDDTFSPVIHRFVVGRGGRYTAELERALFSQRQLSAAAAAAEAGLAGSPEELLRAYFQEREKYLHEHPIRVTEGTGALLERLQESGVRTVCYGGLGKEHFAHHLGRYASYFDDPVYVCTNDFRPGLREIAEDVCGLRCDQALFVDDVARVAEAAQNLGASFVGHPSQFEHGFQPQLMRQAGVRHIVRSLDEIDERLLRTVDAEAAAAFARRSKVAG